MNTKMKIIYKINATKHSNEGTCIEIVHEKTNTEINALDTEIDLFHCIF
jgi:hypothetical protein